MKHFAPNFLGLKVLTPHGYESFAGVALMGERPICRIEFTNHRHLECSDKHRLITINGPAYVSDLLAGDQVYTKGGRLTKVKTLQDTGRVERVYDLVEVNGGHRYYTNGIASANCSFVSDDETLINSLTLSRMVAKPPISYTGMVRWYHDPEPNHAFLVALDPAMGTERNYGAIEVFQMPEMIQIAEWQHNGLAARHQVRVLMEILCEIEATLLENPEQINDPEIYWTFENNSLGEGVLTIVEDTGEERFPGMLVTERRRKGLQMRRVRRGLLTTNRNKLSACARLKSLIESDRMVIHSNNLLRELKNYVASDTSFHAKQGENDDLVSATLMVVRMLDIALAWGTVAGDLREYISDDEMVVEPMPVVI